MWERETRSRTVELLFYFGVFNYDLDKDNWTNDKMHDAYESTTLLEKLPLKIEAIACYGNVYWFSSWLENVKENMLYCSLSDILVLPLQNVNLFFISTS